MLSKIFAMALQGADAFRICVEVSVSNGIGNQITGLPDDAIKESLCRIGIALTDNGFFMPRTRLVINMAPAGVRKIGTSFDLAITVGILIASGQISDIGKLKNYVVVGEIGLDGSIHPVPGALCLASRAKDEGFKGIVLPDTNANEAALVDGIQVFSVTHLRELIQFINCDGSMKPLSRSRKIKFAEPDATLDYKDVKGQRAVKRALEIAATGGHNAILLGPPGAGKTMLAKRLPSIMPPMTIDEALETTKIYSVSNIAGPFTKLITERPFRSPHHTSSDVALVGGGPIPFPGEISLAHNGILFLDELPEFKRSTIETLRQPLEEKKVLIARAKMSVEYPSSFMLIAGANPCFCGYFGHPIRKCTCSRRALYWYRRRISGPLLERIDLHVEVDSVSIGDLAEQNESRESSATIRDRVIAARQIQTERFLRSNVICNANIPDRDIERFCAIESVGKKFLFQNINELQLSARSYTRILRIARTIADLSANPVIEIQHVAEALHFRALDKPFIIPPGKKNVVKRNSNFSFAV